MEGSQPWADHERLRGQGNSGRPCREHQNICAQLKNPYTSSAAAHALQRCGPESFQSRQAHGTVDKHGPVSLGRGVGQVPRTQLPGATLFSPAHGCCCPGVGHEAAICNEADCSGTDASR